MTAHAVTDPMAPELAAILSQGRRDRLRKALWAVLGLGTIAAALYVSDLFNFVRYGDSYRTFTTLIADSLPPDFRRAAKWGRPLLDTLAMSLAGTAIAFLCALPLSALASGLVGGAWVRRAVRFVMNVTRSIPLVVWGIACVAAVGFGPLPGALALAIHSTGALGEFFAEILEHVDPAPGDALRSQGVSRLGVLRFAVLPQILPRVMDVSLYRWEHNVRAATLMGVIGAGGIGLEIMTAFQLFEYREAIALVVVLLIVVTAINTLSGMVRGRFLRAA
jgi:phosphonate transport system permease protein